MSAPDTAAGSAPAHFAEAMEFGRAARWQDAAPCFLQALRADGTQWQAAQGLLECANALVRSGQPAPAPVDDGTRAAGTISIVVCSIDAARLDRLRADLTPAFAAEPWELVHIPDARSLCEGYMRGLARARGELLVFCHDDIGLLCADFAQRLRRHLAHADLLGVAGSTRLAGPLWHWSGAPYGATWIAAPERGGILCSLLGAHGPRVLGAQALDGVLLAGHRHVFESLGFDAATFDGFHFYDLDFSYRAHRAELRCAIALDLLIWHASGGNYDARWQKYAERFVAKFPELEPRAPPAPARPGALVVPDPRRVAPLYAWIAHWVSAH